MLVCGSIVALASPPPVIGVARSRGAFMINQASVPGSATILDGTSVQTVATSSDVSLKGGERVTLASHSAARIYQGRLVLQSGAAELSHLSGYLVETGDLRIGASNAEAHVRVVVDSKDQVRVATIGGNAEVRNNEGMLVARVFPGTAMQLNSAPGAGTKLTGTVQEENGKFFLTDEATKVKVELRGPNLKSMVGKRVRITGTAAPGETPAGDATLVVHVSGSVALAAAAGATAAGGAAAGAGAAGAAGGAAAGAAVATGVSATTVAVVGGVAAAASVGGLAAAGTIGGSDSTVSR